VNNYDIKHNRKRNKIMNDFDLTTKQKGYLIYKLFVKYYPNINLQNDIIYFDEFKYFEKMRPSIGE